MTVGVEPCQADLFKGSGFVGERLAAESVFAVLEREGRRLFPDGMFDDLFSSRGRRSVPPRVVATVMVLQRWFGLSDREAVAAFEFDLRWRFACGGLDVDGGGFCHTVLVGMRARLAASGRPRRIFDAVLDAARSAGALSQRRVLDSVPLYDAVATQDTVTMLHRAIGAVLAAAADAAVGVAVELRGGYATGARPHCDWDDPEARQELVDRLGADAAAVLAALEGRKLDGALSEAAELLAAVAGQDLCQDDGGRFVIARRVAADRVLSTVDPDARHGHKSTARRFDGYKGHTAVDPDSELITATAVTPANTADAQPAPELINDLLNTPPTPPRTPTPPRAPTPRAPTPPRTAGLWRSSRAGPRSMATARTAAASSRGCSSRVASTRGAAPSPRPRRGAASPRTASSSICSAAPSPAPPGRPSSSEPAATARARPRSARPATGARCAAAAPTPAGGRTVRIGTNEAVLAASRARQRDPAWRNDYRAVRPKVERKLAHLVRRKHGGRHARVRGRAKVDADFNLLAAAANIARLGVLGLRSTPDRWALG